MRNRRKILGIRKDTLKKLWEIVRSDIKGATGFTIVTIFLAAAIFAPELAPYDPMAQKFDLFKPPSFTGPNPLGTDSYGRDLLSRLMHGARISLTVGFLSVFIGGLFGVNIGLLAGYFGGRIDDVLMRFVDWMWAFPYLLVAMLLIVIFERSIWAVIAALSFAYVDDFARIIRGEVISIREEEYVLAATSIGRPNSEIIYREILPNTLAPLIVEGTILVARAMLAEATLSFLGFGVKATTPTWGSLLGQGRNFVTQAWWISVIPGLCIMLTVLGIHLFGDALRDAFDVKETD